MGPETRNRIKKIGWIIILFIYFMFIFAVLPIWIIISLIRDFQNKEIIRIIGGICVVLTLLVSLWGISCHMIYYSKPSLQKYIIRILWMVPIYSLNGWIGLTYPKQDIYVDCARACYEAFVIYNFLVYLFNYLNEKKDVETNPNPEPEIKHYFPCCCLPNLKKGRQFVQLCKHGILQYTVIRPITTGITFLCVIFGVYGEGKFQSTVAYPYLLIVNNISQLMATYALGLFYVANKSDLKPIKPLPKFGCIKAVIFFSFFQEAILSVLGYFGIFDIFLMSSFNEIRTRKETPIEIQNFLICIEMLIAGIAHHFTFSYHPFINNVVKNRSLIDAFYVMSDVSDIRADIKEYFSVVEINILFLDLKLGFVIAPILLLSLFLFIRLPEGSSFSNLQGSSSVDNQEEQSQLISNQYLRENISLSNLDPTRSVTL